MRVAPEVHGEGPLEVVVAVEDARVDLLDVDGHAGALGLLREHLGGLHAAGAGGRGADELDGEVVVVAGLLEQRLGLLDVLRALRQVLGVAGVERRVHVVADPAEAAVGLVDHLLAVDDETERLAHVDVVERLLVDAHGEGLPAAGLGLEERVARRGLDGGGLGGVDERRSRPGRRAGR